MYTDETGKSCIKVYPNKDAIKQMKLKNSFSCSFEDFPQSRDFSQDSKKAETPESVTSSDALDGFFTLLILTILLSDNSVCDSILFTLILGILFIY